MSIKSSFDTLAYYNFVSIDILPYAFLQISEVLTLQSPASSVIQTPDIFTTAFLSIMSPFMDRRVVKYS